MAMYDVVILICEKNITLVSSVVILLTRYNEFKTMVTQLKSYLAQLVMDITGPTLTKKDYRLMLARKGSDLAAIINSFALDINDNDLAQKMLISETDIKYGRDEKVVPYCTDIYNAGITNLIALADYNIDGAMLSEFSTLITAYEQVNQKPRQVRVERKTLNRNIKLIFVDLDNILYNHIDKQMRTFRTSYPGFHQDFTNARIIIDFRAHTTPRIIATKFGMIGGYVYDAVTSLPIPFASVLITELGFVDEADEDADFFLENTPFGKYTIQVSALGYETLVKNDYEINSEDCIEEAFFLTPLPAEPTPTPSL